MQQGGRVKLVRGCLVGDVDYLHGETRGQPVVGEVVGEEATVDLRLQVSAAESQITVDADAPMVSTTTRDTSGFVGEQQVKDLQLNGRSYDLLLTLNPGIVNFTSQKTGGTGISNSTTANNFSVPEIARSKISFC